MSGIWTDCPQCGPHELAPLGDIGQACFCTCHTITTDTEGDMDG